MKMLSILFFLIPVIYIFIFNKYWNKKIFESIIFGFVIFLGVNSLYFFSAYILNVELSLLILYTVNIGYILLIYFFEIKNKKFEKIEVNSRSCELLIAVVGVLITVVFLLNFKTIDNGLRIPIPSFTEDASQHFNFTLKTLSGNKLLDGFYPFAFHGNAWLFLKIATYITGLNSNTVFITNIFSLYIWLITFIIISLISIIIFDLIKVKGRSKYYLQVIIPLLVFVFGSIVSLYTIKYGFFSNLLNQLFSLGIVYFLSRIKSRSIVLSIPLLFGFYFSYSFFIPVLVCFYGYLYYSKKENKYLYLSLISVILFITFFVQALTSVSGFKYLIVASGGFPYYSNLIIFTYIILASVYYFFVFKKNKKNRTLDYLSSFGILFLLYAVAMAILQVTLNGRISYSFYKIFFTSFLFYGILATAGVVTFLFSFSSKKKDRLSLTSIFVKLMPVILLMLLVPNFIDHINPPLADIVNGKGNFFSNNKEKYNAVIFALENYSEFKNVIYIDGDYQSTRWATLSYLPTKFNVFYDLGSVLNYKNYPYYVSVLKQIESKTIILNPTRILEVDCNAKNLINLVTEFPEKILIYPFDLDLFNRNCISKR